MKQVKLLLITAILSVAAQLTWAQVTLSQWTFTNASGSTWPASPYAPVDSNANVSIGGLTRGSGILTQGQTAANAWGGNGFYDNVTPATAATAATLGNFYTFTIKSKTGYSMSLTEIAPYNIRRSGTGPLNFIWQYSIDGTSFTDIGSALLTGGNTDDVGNPKVAVALDGISALQNLPATTTVTFRLLAWGGTTSQGGTFYFNGSSTATNNNLRINGTVAPSTPLPLTLISFKGTSTPQANVLSWSTANEENVARFELERGTNGQNFNKIAVIEAKGNNATTRNHYAYEDAITGSVDYYRLKMIDRDDKATYSDIVLLRNDVVKNDVRIYPNPAEGTLNIEGLNAKSSYRITDIMGKEVISLTAATGNNPVSVDVSGLTEGTYLLQFTDDKGNYQHVRFVKK